MAVKVNLYKHACEGHACGSTANVLASDGFVSAVLCVRCSRAGTVRRHVRRYNGTVMPLAQTICGEDCK